MDAKTSFPANAVGSAIRHLILDIDDGDWTLTHEKGKHAVPLLQRGAKLSRSHLHKKHPPGLGDKRTR